MRQLGSCPAVLREAQGWTPDGAESTHMAVTVVASKGGRNAALTDHKGQDRWATPALIPAGSGRRVTMNRAATMQTYQRPQGWRNP